MVTHISIKGRMGVGVQDPHQTRPLPPFRCAVEGSPKARQEPTTAPVGEDVPQTVGATPQRGPPDGAQGTTSN